MFKSALQTVAKAKLVYNKKLDMYKLVCAFNAHKRFDEAGNVKYAFPTQSKCNYVSGDITLEDLASTLAVAQAVMRTTNIDLVE
jgi:hypothetical protein